MTEVPQPSVTSSEKEKMVTSSEKSFRAARQEEEISEPPTHEVRPVAVSNQPCIQPEEAETHAAAAAPVEPAAVYTAPETFPSAAAVSFITCHSVVVVFCLLSP